MKHISLYFIILCGITVHAKSLLDSIITDYRQVTLDRLQECKNSYIGYVHYQGKQYIVKQKKCIKNGSIQLAHCNAREALSAYLARSIKANAHEVSVIPQDIPFPGKKISNRSATLHTIVPGLRVKAKENPYRLLRIQQRFRNIHQGCKGLTLEVIKNMSLHKDLVLIVALDTFIGNSDRHNDNLFYQEDKDTFFAIDMENTFNKNLAAEGVTHLQTILHEEQELLTQSELQALLQYQDALQHLSLFSPTQLVRLYIQFRQTALSTRSARHLLTYKLRTSIERNYKSVQTIIRLIEKIEKKYQKIEKKRKKTELVKREIYLI